MANDVIWNNFLEDKSLQIYLSSCNGTKESTGRLIQMYFLITLTLPVILRIKLKTWYFLFSFNSTFISHAIANIGNLRRSCLKCYENLYLQSFWDSRYVVFEVIIKWANTAACLAKPAFVKCQEMFVTGGFHLYSSNFLFLQKVLTAKNEDWNIYIWSSYCWCILVAFAVYLFKTWNLYLV